MCTSRERCDAHILHRSLTRVLQTRCPCAVVTKSELCSFDGNEVNLPEIKPGLRYVSWFSILPTHTLPLGSFKVLRSRTLRSYTYVQRGRERERERDSQTGPDENVKNNPISLRCGFAVQFDVTREFVTHDTRMIGILPLPLCFVVNHISFEYGYRCCFYHAHWENHSRI